jgi:hypothetical protein
MRNKYFCVIIFLFLTNCTSIYYSKFSKPSTNATDERTSIISYESGNNYYLAHTNSVFQYNLDDFTIAVKLNNQEDYPFLIGGACIPFIPFFCISLPFGLNEGYSVKARYIDLIIGFKKNSANPILFNPSNVIIQLPNMKSQLSPERYIDLGLLKYPTHEKKTSELVFPSHKENSSDIEFTGSTKFLLRYKVNLSYKTTFSIKLPAIIYKNNKIELPEILFKQDSEFSYMPLFM